MAALRTNATLHGLACNGAFVHKVMSTRSVTDWVYIITISILHTIYEAVLVSRFFVFFTNDSAKTRKDDD
jgi:hypothetical protein